MRWGARLRSRTVAQVHREAEASLLAVQILLAHSVTRPAQPSLNLIDIDVERNAYGRQIDSRVANISPGAEFQKRAGAGDVEAVFIRAPIIRRTGPGVKVLAEYDGDPVLVEQGKYLVATFHPELTTDSRVHRMFLVKME